ncbi:hypothetical protein DB30_05519 [Enhygromyxa salina]|uniref:Uncharacterized protein n=1 Tax=Enhygromyxa salina TaxID=215803 RepID=A0A0C2CWT6_9BACT|nr:hypothetical protein DB30_05519 [Enhygromyxa salina]
MSAPWVERRCGSATKQGVRHESELTMSMEMFFVQALRGPWVQSRVLTRQR